jgi:four helix bundle protein
MDGFELDSWEESSVPAEHLIEEPRDGYWSGGPRDLACWRNAMELVKSVYAVTKNWPPEERYDLTSQTRRAAVSVPANIAEGHGRFSKREFLHHLSIASGSLREVETLLEIARDAQYLPEGEWSRLVVQVEQTRRPLKGLFGYLRGNE